MATYKTRDFENALEAKGFRRDDVHHAMFWYYLEGRKTSLRTRTSHGEPEFDDSLLSQRRRQIGLTTKPQMLDFIHCPMSAEQYRQHLIDSGRVHPPKQESRADSDAGADRSTDRDSQEQGS